MGNGIPVQTRIQLDHLITEVGSRYQLAQESGVSRETIKHFRDGTVTHPYQTTIDALNDAALRFLGKPFKLDGLISYEEFSVGEWTRRMEEARRETRAGRRLRKLIWTPRRLKIRDSRRRRFRDPLHSHGSSHLDSQTRFELHTHRYTRRIIAAWRNRQRAKGHMRAHKGGFRVAIAVGTDERGLTRTENYWRKTRQEAEDLLGVRLASLQDRESFIKQQAERYNLPAKFVRCILDHADGVRALGRRRDLTRLDFIFLSRRPNGSIDWEKALQWIVTAEGITIAGTEDKSKLLEALERNFRLFKNSP